jgi:hypothetical protein
MTEKGEHPWQQCDVIETKGHCLSKLMKEGDHNFQKYAQKELAKCEIFDIPDTEVMGRHQTKFLKEGKHNFQVCAGQT